MHRRRQLRQPISMVIGECDHNKFRARFRARQGMPCEVIMEVHGAVAHHDHGKAWIIGCMKLKIMDINQ